MIGKTVSHYRILAKLGEGGMGAVYRAEDTRLRRVVALKFLPPDLTRDADAKRRLIQEAQAASALDHPNICTVFEIDETPEGRLFMAMACYDGETLKERIARGPLNPPDALDIVMSVAQGLARAHEQSIVHRDIKPANVFVTKDGQVKIVDFGLAKLPGTAGITRTGATVGTASYMSPEQVRGEDVDHRTDIWSLGALLYELLTGQKPFKSEYEQAAMYSILHDDPPAITSLEPQLPAELEQIVCKAMAKDPEDRYQDVKGVLRDLDVLRRELRPTDYTGPRTGKAARGRRGVLTTMALPALVLIAALTAVWLLTRGDGPGPVTPGNPFRVTHGDAWDCGPALSPEGGRIAYASDEAGSMDIHVVGVHGGNPLRLTTEPSYDSDPTWFPDGGTVAFVSDRGGRTGIWKVDQFGGGAMLLMPNGYYPAISPDGERMAFSRAAPGDYLRICIAPLADPGRATFLTGDDGGLWDHRCPAFSPDGSRICYAGHHNLWTVPSGGGPPSRLTSEGTYDSDPCWSSDGKFVYFSSSREGTQALWRVSDAGGAPERLTMGTGQEGQPSVSRDGSRLVYCSQVGELHLVTADLHSGQETRLPGLLFGHSVAVAPDGSQVAFVPSRSGPSADLWSQRLHRGRPSGPPKRLTDHAGVSSHPAFSPDGRWIAYYRIIDEQRDIWIIPASGGRPIQFTEHPATDVQPAWSPDGSMLAFASERQGGPHIWIAPVEDGRRAGSPRRMIGEDVSASAPSWSPDGTQIAFIGHARYPYDVWVGPADGDAPARQVTAHANAARVRWDYSTGALLVSGTWAEDRFTLRRVPPDGGEPVALDPPVVFGPKTGTAAFDVSSDGHLVVFSRKDIKGNVWVLEAEEGVY